MKNEEPISVLDIKKSRIPVYKQIIEQIVLAINNKQISSGQALPSINELSDKFNLSRDTVQKAYNHLKRMGAIDSVQGKGFYVSTDNVPEKTRVFVLFDVLFTNFKEVLFNSIKEYLNKEEYFLDIHFHHQDPEVFRDKVKKAYGHYDCYVIMPLTNYDEGLSDLFEKLEGDKNVLLLDIHPNLKSNNHNKIVQNHDQGFEDALENQLNEIKKYKVLVLVFPEDRYHPISIKNAFNRFAYKQELKARVIEQLSCADIEKDNLYILLENSDLVRLIKQCHNVPKLWDEIGCIAYNDSPLKEIIEGGISVISTDFVEMGRKAAEFIKHRERVDITLPTRIINRKSF